MIRSLYLKKVSDFSCFGQVFSSFNPFPSLPSVATEDNSEFKKRLRLRLRPRLRPRHRLRYKRMGFNEETNR